MIFKETETTELKRILNDTFEKALVAFLNTTDGTIYIGVEDDGRVIGVEHLDDTLKKIADIITTQILPNPQEFVKLGTVYENGKHVIEVQVRKGNALYYIKKYGRSAAGCYIRMGTSSRSMTEEQIERKYVESVSIPEKSISDVPVLRNDFTFAKLKQYLISNGIHINEDTFYRNFGLVTADGQFNVLAELLADENMNSVKVAVFKGTDKSQFSKRNEYGYTCLIESLEKVINYCDALNETYVDVSVRPRIERRMFDGEAFKEAWVNACVHNKWVSEMPPAVYWFDDRLEIVSYGGIPKNLTKEEFLAGKTDPVNKDLMKIFLQCGIVEQSGHGVPIVVREYGESAYTFSENMIIVTIPFYKGENITPKDGAINGAINLTDKEMSVYQCIKNNPDITKTELIQTLSIPKTTVDRIIKKLKEKGYIEYIGSRKTGYWKLLK